MFGLFIQHVPDYLKKTATHVIGITKHIEDALKSNTAIELAALIPGGGQLEIDAIAACEMAIKTCQAAIAIGDSSGFKGRLQRLGTDLMAMHHPGEHRGIWYFVTCFELVFHDLFGKKDDDV